MFQVLMFIISLQIEILKILTGKREDLALELLAARQQLANYKVKKVKPRITDVDRSFWITLKKKWHNWKEILVVVKPETVTDWQERRFRNYWT